MAAKPKTTTPPAEEAAALERPLLRPEPKKEWVALRPILHDGKHYPIGKPILLTQTEAARLGKAVAMPQPKEN
ncbi:MAG: hypothetical protein LBL69_03700 [Zoogloeaceae bacterium]|jgi:hypothetical protein|nr:hypothetical protein [Zoogloeaceae bacterium]